MSPLVAAADEDVLALEFPAVVEPEDCCLAEFGDCLSYSCASAELLYISTLSSI